MTKRLLEPDLRQQDTGGEGEIEAKVYLLMHLEFLELQSLPSYASTFVRDS